MLEAYDTKKLSYDKLTKDEMNKRGILGRLSGVIADGKNPTRNGRKYSKKLWENVFENPIVREAIDNRLCLGELGHPEDRTETDMEKICICLNGYPKINKDDQLIGNFDILDTPNGRILNTLCNYGATIGVSSRGEGDLYTDDNGDECVDEGTYQFQCFDAVIIPAVEAARMNYMTESLSNKKSLTEALNKELNNASDNDRRIMLETLDTLGLEETYKVTRNEEGQFEVADTEGNVIKKVNNKDSALNIAKKLEYNNTEPEENNGPDEDEPLDIPEPEVDNDESMMEELQEALSDNKKLRKQLMEVQKDLSVSIAKEEQYKETIHALKESISKLSVNTKRVSGLETRVTQLSEALQKSNEQITTYQDKINKNTEEKKRINESMSNDKDTIKKLTDKVITLEDKYKDQVKNLIEDLSKAKGSTTLLKEKLDKQEKLVEKYKKISTACVDKYIESKAQMIGTTSAEIKNRLPESYNFNDIDRIVEELRSYKVNMSKLPFDLNRTSNIGVKRSKNESLSRRPRSNDWDEDLTSLYSLAGLEN